MKKCKESICFLLFCSAMIISKMDFLKILDIVFITCPRITGWHLSHLITYFIVGKLCPNNFYTYILVGIGWELFEYLYGIYTKKPLYWTSGGYTGQLTDIIMNIIGYSLAHII